MTITDQSTQVRPGEELDAAVIDPYLKDHIPGLEGLPTISQFPGGASNLTYLLAYPQREFVLRRPPFGHKAKSAHDMAASSASSTGSTKASLTAPKPTCTAPTNRWSAVSSM